MKHKDKIWFDLLILKLIFVSGLKGLEESVSVQNDSDIKVLLMAILRRGYNCDVAGIIPHVII